jgi:hypothetical protein
MILAFRTNERGTGDTHHRCSSLPPLAASWHAFTSRHLSSVVQGENRAPAFLAINPLGKVPALQDMDGFCLQESAAMLRYLCETRAVAEHWYPSEFGVVLAFMCERGWVGQVGWKCRG